MAYVLAADIGGTFLRVALVRGKTIAAMQKIPTPRREPELFAAVKDEALALMQGKKLPLRAVRGIGIAFAGGVLPDGRVRYSPNSPVTGGTNLERRFGGLFGRRVYALNDMKATALGELYYGQAKGKTNVLCVTVSTGIGSAIIANGAVYWGADSLAGEIGRLVVDLNEPLAAKNGSGNFEYLASGTALEREAKKIFKKTLSAHEIQTLAERGNQKAQVLFNRSAEYLAAGFVGLINALNPELVIVSGSHILRGFDLLMPTIRSAVKRYALSPCPIVKTKLGEDAALLGAAAFALSRPN